MRAAQTQIDFFTVAQVAARYQVSAGWVTDHCTGKRNPRLPGQKIGKSWRFTAAHLEEFDRLCTAIANQIAGKKQTRRVA